MSPHTDFLQGISWLCGWIYFLCWASASYPQPVVNFRRKSVTGLSVDAFVIAAVGHSCYTVSCLVFLYSETVRRQYRRRWGDGAGDPTVRFNDLMSTAHAVFWSYFTVTQFYWWGYTKLPSQKLSRGIKYIIIGCFSIIAAAIGVVLMSPREDISSGEAYTGTYEWLDVIYLVGHIKLFLSVIKYYPQVYLNYVNKSTRGWAIHKCVMDFAGSFFSLFQLCIDASLTPGGIGNIIGNPVKLWLACISMGFESVFMVQHWVIYRPKKKSEHHEYRTRANRSRLDEEARGLLPVDDARAGGQYGTINHAALVEPITRTPELARTH